MMRGDHFLNNRKYSYKGEGMSFPFDLFPINLTINLAPHIRDRVLNGKRNTQVSYNSSGTSPFPTHIVHPSRRRVKLSKNKISMRRNLVT